MRPETHIRTASCQHGALKASHFYNFCISCILSGKADVSGECNLELVFWGQLTWVFIGRTDAEAETPIL